MLCGRDDDSGDGLLFELWNSKGAKAQSQVLEKAAGELLGHSVSNDGRLVVFRLSNRSVELWEFNGRVLVRVGGYRVGGRVADAIVSTGEHPVVALLWTAPLGPPLKIVEPPVRMLSIIGHDGIHLVDQALSQRFDTLSFAGESRDLAAFGNNAHGQGVAWFSANNKWRQEWGRGLSHPAQFLPSGQAFISGAIAPYEDFTAGDHHSHIASYARNGDLNWDVALETRGGFLYAVRTMPSASAVVVASDDGRISWIEYASKVKSK